MVHSLPSTCSSLPLASPDTTFSPSFVMATFTCTWFLGGEGGRGREREGEGGRGREAGQLEMATFTCTYMVCFLEGKGGGGGEGGGSVRNVFLMAV